MKRLWVAITLIGSITILCIVSAIWQMHTLSKLEQALDQTEQLVRSGDLKRGTDAAKAFQNLCIESGEAFGFLEQHGDCFILKETASLLPTLLQQEELSLFYTEAARCRFCIKELRRERTPALNNIF